MGREEVLMVLKKQYPELSKRFGVKSLRLFGSVVRGEAGADSDLDVLVDFGGPARLFGACCLVKSHEDILGRTVDLVTVRGLREELRPAVEREAVHVA